MREALAGEKRQAQGGARDRRAFAACLRMVGYGWLNDALELAIIAWEATRDFWRRIFC